MSITQAATKKLKLFSRRKVVTLLSGNYDSLFRGRSLEIESLREYVVGDDVKDIDWKTTARLGAAQTRLYSAQRDQRVLIVADTSRSMLLDGYTALKKVDALYGVCIMLGMFVRQNQDLIGLSAVQSNNQIALSRFSNTNQHVESILQTIEQSLHTQRQADTPLETLCDRTLSLARKRAAIFVISDSVPDLETFKKTIRHLSQRNQVFYVQLAPTSPFVSDTDDEYAFRDISSDQALSASLATNPTLEREWTTNFTNWWAQAGKICAAQGVAHGLITDAAKVPEVLTSMFAQTKRYARHRG